MSNMDMVKNTLKSLLDPVASTEERGPLTHAQRDALVEAMFQGSVAYKEPAEGTAATEASTQFFRALHALKIKRVTIQPQDALTANDTNYKTVAVKKADGAAGSETVVASQTTKITGGSGDWVDKTQFALALSATLANLELAAGEVLILDIAAAASGVATPEFIVNVDYELI